VRSASETPTIVDRSVNAAFRALAEPRRRMILHQVWSMEMPASHIAARFDDIASRQCLNISVCFGAGS
jgi:DNA-binding transcriptional ArsR family regulator